MAATPYLWYGGYLLAYLPTREIEMSDSNRSTNVQRPQRAARDRGLLGAGSRNDPGRLRLRVTRRAEPDVHKLVDWVLNIAQARYDAHRAGEPDPYGLPTPDGLGPASDERGKVEAEPLHQRRSTA
ncbi:hypothetical protein BN12_110005 [Nostocoides japonicum T1-X7]|uniref:Uncharacterized protein n=1 Tax=Nostocoides japonicum T1-X7 TaxID=1194083 RepID=A0A077LVZ0_9MICO|nr:hypothetical protein BN12_110005 [Tetrasphaera japonica T1-X7]